LTQHMDTDAIKSNILQMVFVLDEARFM